MADFPKELRIDADWRIPPQTIHCAVGLYLYLHHHLTPLGYEVVIDDALTFDELKVSADVYEGVSPAYLSASLA